MYCRLLFKIYQFCLFLIGNDGLSSKQVGSQASRRVTRRLAWIQPVCISINAVPALKELIPINPRIISFTVTVNAIFSISDHTPVYHRLINLSLVFNLTYLSYIYLQKTLLTYAVMLSKVNAKITVFNVITGYR